MDIRTELDKLLKLVEKPARYIGSEIGITVKNPEDVDCRMAFIFPDVYEIGMSYTGMQLLYHIINREPNLCLERVFHPGADMADLMRERNVPLFTLETKTPVKDMDMVGITLQYEMSYTSILNCLDLAGIPLLAEERGEDMPLIFAGGPCAYQPEPMADVFDFFEIGDGEDLMPLICRKYAEFKKTGGTKEEFLKSICNIQGIYVPRFYEPEYNEDGTIKEIKKTYEGAPDRVLRAFLPDLNGAPWPREIIVPLIDVVQDRAVVEPMRGCSQGCRFCQAGNVYRPVRERSRQECKEILLKQLDFSGHEDASVLSLSTSDYTEFEDFIRDMLPICKERNMDIELPSLRMDNLAFTVMEELREGRRAGLTLAIEAGTQRLRDVINKTITDDDIYTATRKAIELGWNTIKIYYMCGLPTETLEDIAGIAEISKNILKMYKDYDGKKGGRFKINASVANFIPKAHTPFQWCGQDTQENFDKKHAYLKQLMRANGLNYAYHETYVSVLESLIARGDRRVGKTIIKAFENGARLDAWTEHFNEQAWKDAIEETGLDLAFYTTRWRSFDEVLPWSIIDCGITDEYLKNEYNKAVRGETTRDCREGCNGCGINQHVECKFGGIF